jgi:hypothetical protein
LVHGATVTPDLLQTLSTFPKSIATRSTILTKNQLEQANQIKDFAIALNRHIPAYEGMSLMTKKLSNEIHLLKREIGNFRKEESKKIKSNLKEGTQKSINDFTW